MKHLPDLPQTVDLSESIAAFAFSPGITDGGSPEPEAAPVSLVLRTSSDAAFSRGDFLCRAYPLTAEGAPIATDRCSWTSSSHFDAPFAYLPEFAGDALVPLNQLAVEDPYSHLVLAVHPWRDAARTCDVSVRACFRRERLLVNGQPRLSYHPLRHLTVA